MTFLEALYGSQYHEIQQKGRDGNKGRLNANAFLTAFIILIVITVCMFCIRFVPGFNDKLSDEGSGFTEATNGKSIGKLLAIPLFVIIYLLISNTVGSATNFKKHVDSFMQLPDEVKQKANRKLLAPFFILLAVVLFLTLG